MLFKEAAAHCSVKLLPTLVLPANRMNTLDGALSNLQDEWDKTFRYIYGGILDEDTLKNEFEDVIKPSSLALS